MTISEIARLAGVSSAAVSRYLNGGSLSPEKREQIKKIVEEYGYVPSACARTMRTKKSMQVGVIIPKIDSESMPSIVAGISSTLNEAGYNFLLADTGSRTEKELEYLEFFRHYQLDGVIFAAAKLTDEHKKALKILPIPIVIIGQYLEEYPCVYHSDREAAFEMTSKLLKAGCKKIAYIGVDEEDLAAGMERKKGVCEAIQKHREKVEYMVSDIADFTRKSGYETMQNLLEKYPDLDGVFCATDDIAIGAMIYLKESGKKIPQEIKIAGIGDSDMGKVITPKLTTAHYHYRTSGKKAAQLLLDEMESGTRGKEKIQLGFEVIERETL